MKLLLKLANFFDWLATKLGRLAGWVIMPLIFVIMFDVITRKIDYTRLWFSDLSIASGGFSVSTILQDSQWHFHAIILMLTFGIGYLANSHVRVDIFREMLSRRKQAWVELIGLICLAMPFLLIMLQQSFELTELAFNQGEGSESLTGIPKRWMIKAFVVIGFVLVLGAVLATIFRLIGTLFGNEENKAMADSGLKIFADDNDELEKARLAAEAALAAEEEAIVAAAAAAESAKNGGTN
jgi:TRAP-type mannitol/chloroaromatic compound transport system permease small subunit